MTVELFLESEVRNGELIIYNPPKKIGEFEQEEEEE